MNDQPDPNAWDGTPQERMPALAPDSQPVPWTPPPAGYSDAVSGYGLQEESNFVHDLWRYFWILFRHRWVVLGITGFFVCVGLLVTLLSTPIFRASATMQIDREPAKILNVQEVQADVGSEVAFYATQYEILKSRSLAEQVVANLSVAELEAFARHDIVSLWAKLRHAAIGIFRASDEARAKDTDVAGLQNMAVQKLLGGLSVQPVGSSRVVRLSFDYPDPGWSQRIVNSVSETFVALTLERRFDASSYARGFLEERLKELKLKLEDSEAELVAYAQEQRIVNVDERKSLVSANLVALNEQLAETSRERLKAAQLLEQAESTDGLALPQILADESIGRMRETRAELAAEYQDKHSFFKPEYPEMMKLQARIDEIDRQIAESVAVVRESLRANHEALLAQEKSLKRELETLKADVLDLESRGIQYRILQREVDTNRELYDGLLQRFKEVGVAGAVGTNNVSIVDAAVRPGAPFKPRLSKNLAIAFAFGLLCGGTAAFGMEFLDDTYKVPEEVEAGLGLPVLGIIPQSQSTEALTKALSNTRSSLSEAYRSLRTAIQFSTPNGAPRTLLVTSSRPSEGKSTTALAIARNFAQLGQRVLLIDGDMRNPSLHRTMGLTASAGLSNYSDRERAAIGCVPDHRTRGPDADGVRPVAA
jgi:succinoglycan biosynthesis transport protein ExoP